MWNVCEAWWLKVQIYRSIFKCARPLYWQGTLFNRVLFSHVFLPGCPPLTTCFSTPLLWLLTAIIVTAIGENAEIHSCCQHPSLLVYGTANFLIPSPPSSPPISTPYTYWSMSSQEEYTVPFFFSVFLPTHFVQPSQEQGSKMFDHSFKSNTDAFKSCIKLSSFSSAGKCHCWVGYSYLLLYIRNHCPEHQEHSARV